MPPIETRQTGPRCGIFWAYRSLKQEKAGNTTARPNTYPIRPVCSPKKIRPVCGTGASIQRARTRTRPHVGRGRRVPSPAGQAGTWRRSLEPWTSSAGDPALRLPALPHRTHPGIHAVASCLMPRRLGVTRGEPWHQSNFPILPRQAGCSTAPTLLRVRGIFLFPA